MNEAVQGPALGRSPRQTLAGPFTAALAATRAPAPAPATAVTEDAFR